MTGTAEGVSVRGMNPDEDADPYTVYDLRLSG